MKTKTKFPLLLLCVIALSILGCKQTQQKTEITPRLRVLSVDGKEVAKGRTDRTIGARFSLDETLDVGEDTGTPVEFNVYDVTDKFDGKLNKLTVDLKK